MKLKKIYEEVINENMGIEFYHGSPYRFDKFDFNKIGSGDGLAKFGYGLYFADTKETAMYYAKELSIGSNRATGFNLYTVRLFGLDDYYNWEEETPAHVADCVMRKLIKIGKSDTADLMATEYEDYGNYWSMRSLYEILIDTLGGGKETSEFLSLCGVNGVVGESPAHDGYVYTCYDDSLIKIINVQNV